MKQTIAYITDIHLDETFVMEQGVDSRANWTLLLADIRNRKINKLIFGGDIGEPAANQWFFESLEGFDLDLTLGNHDTFPEASKHVKHLQWPVKNEGCYSKEDDYFKYLFLDSSRNVLSNLQKHWLTEELMTDKTVLVFIHHPILAVDTPADHMYPLEERAEVKQILLHSNKAITLFCGHYHMPDERSEGPIKQFITPAASFQIIKEVQELKMDNSVFGYRLIHLDGCNLTTGIVWFKMSSE